MLNKMYTERGESLKGTPWEVYPRPQLRRDSYLNLNGTWELTVDGRSDSISIQVPFCPESPLSGVGSHFPEGSTLCYRRSFRLPDGFNRGRVLLHIGAADQRAEVFVNGTSVGCHEGGYTAFAMDITEALAEDNLLEVRCVDDLRDTSMLYGKQSLRRGGMWYTPVSGLWQTVWLESVPTCYIEGLRIENQGYGVRISVRPVMEGRVKVEGLGEYPLREGEAVIEPEAPRLWSPEEPYLYNFSVITEEDRVESYFAIRHIETKVVDGIPRLCLNGRPYFFHGLLDQGYWPDGIYTPAAPECYVDDIMAMKKLGFNTLRKHIKIEADEFYYQCDRLGMVVFQDMVNNGDYSFLRDTLVPTVRIQRVPDKRMHKDPDSRRRFLCAMEETVAQLGNHPCILYWTVFNEGWGQFDSDSVYQKLRSLDSTRIIDTTSGWFRRKGSDVESLHIYFGPWNQIRSGKRPVVLSEFGGYACGIEGHVFNPSKAYGYKICKTTEDFQKQIMALYRNKVLPSIKKGLCGAVCTQVSDVEDEINGFLTYDRRLCKADEKAMRALSVLLQEQLEKNCEQ
ncbi:MAG: glycoside hydrolase family 2 [Clostridia bacterium]|nr:glycoside hydrolase family 2 [Clostridia bacterium]